MKVSLYCFGRVASAWAFWVHELGTYKPLLWSCIMSETPTEVNALLFDKNNVLRVKGLINTVRWRYRVHLPID